MLGYKPGLRRWQRARRRCCRPSGQRPPSSPGAAVGESTSRWTRVSGPGSAASVSRSAGCSLLHDGTVPSQPPQGPWEKGGVDWGQEPSSPRPQGSGPLGTGLTPAADSFFSVAVRKPRPVSRAHVRQQRTRAPPLVSKLSDQAARLPTCLLRTAGVGAGLRAGPDPSPASPSAAAEKRVAHALRLPRSTWDRRWPPGRRRLARHLPLNPRCVCSDLTSSFLDRRPRHTKPPTGELPRSSSMTKLTS